MKMTANMESEATSDTKTDESQSLLYLQAAFAEKAGLGFDMQRITDTGDYQTWFSSSYQSNLHKIGGDAASLHFDDWV